VEHPNLDSPVYQKRERRPKWNVSVSPLMDPREGGIMLRRRLPDYTKADHESAARYFENEAKRSKGAWNALIEREHERVFHRPFAFTDYKISGIGREEYSEKAKDKLRELAHYASAAGSAAAAHWSAAGHRKRMKEFSQTRRNPARYLKAKDRPAQFRTHLKKQRRRVVIKRQLAKAGVNVPEADRFDTHKLRALRAKQNPLPMFPMYARKKTADAWALIAVFQTLANARTVGNLVRARGYQVRVTDGKD
jgi:hypothetical protein